MEPEGVPRVIEEEIDVQPFVLVHFCVVTLGWTSAVILPGFCPLAVNATPTTIRIVRIYIPHQGRKVRAVRQKVFSQSQVDVHQSATYTRGSGAISGSTLFYKSSGTSILH